jgi:hypothetical protein
MTSHHPCPTGRHNSSATWILPRAATLASTFCLLAGPALAATKPDPRAATQVQKTLAAEAKGDEASRSERLMKVIESAPDYAPARWAAGYVEQEGKWARFDSLPLSDVPEEKLAPYRWLRDETPDDASGHFKLANWCHQHGLKDQERAHLLHVLDFEPNHTEVRQRLGMTQVGGTWMMPREAERAAARGKQAIADLKHWLPRAEKFRTALAGPAGSVRDLAAKHVRAINDPTAVPAFETVLAPSSDEAGAAVVDALGAMKRPNSAIALARLATFSESSETTDAARARLKTLPADYYVPAMLSSLIVPGVQTKVFSDRYGRLVFEQAFVYEGADRKHVAVFDNVYSGRWGRRMRGSDSLLAAETLGSLANAGRSIAADAQNRQIEKTNTRIIETLRDVTGQTLSTDPQTWWQWWNDINEIVPIGEKQTEITYVVQETRLRTRERFYGSCLIAGTPIWTDHGPTAVEKMHVGDKVLAQDVESGELVYKPVLRTTVRPKAPLIHITLADETIVASGGHPFWVAGKGWVNARHLQPDMLIHTVTDTAPVKKVEVEEDGNQPVYNLVVEDFHNYFAGNGHLLLHDITPREPALGTVPGWQE